MALGNFHRSRKAHTATATRAAIQAARQHATACAAARIYPTIAPTAPAKWAAAQVEDIDVPYLREGSYYITTAESIGFRPAAAIAATAARRHNDRAAQVSAQGLILNDHSNHSRRAKKAINAYLRAAQRREVLNNGEVEK